jgi:hypothetical protein
VPNTDSSQLTHSEESPELNSNARHLILSVDYEIFGNGTGDVMRHIVEPAEAMARVCEKFRAPLTLFFEVEEYLAFAAFAGPLQRMLGYDPARAIRDQLIALLRRGHDVQLHLHPQWFGAHLEGETWQLHPENITVDDLFETQEETNAYIAARKAVIEELLQLAGVSRKVIAYRAGAFAAQPGRKLLAALVENGFLFDTSVVKGLHQDGFDYRHAPCSNGPWRIKDDVAVADPAGPLWEFPIYSVPGRRFQLMTFARLRAKFSKSVPRRQQKAMINQFALQKRGPLAALRFLWQPVPIKLDFHNISPATLLRWVHSAPRQDGQGPDVMVFIGHTKEHIDDRGLEKLLQALSRESDIKIISLDTLARTLSANQVSLAAQ